MKTASMLLAVFAVLGFVSEAGAQTMPDLDPDYCITIGDWHFGILDMRVDGQLISTVLFLGPIGPYQVPFTATQGLIGFILILVTLITLLAVFTVRWKKKRACGAVPLC